VVIDTEFGRKNYGSIFATQLRGIEINNARIDPRIKLNL
jgi:hypothetical protein